MTRYRKTVRILALGDEAQKLEKALAGESDAFFEVVAVPKAPRQEEAALFDAVFLDADRVPDWKSRGFMIPVVALCTDLGSSEDALRHGAADTVVAADLNPRVLKRVFQSVIERREHEEQMQKSAGMNLDFLLFVAHEIRGPLAIVKEGVSLVGDKILGEVNPKQEKVLQTARRNIDRIDGLIGGMLDLSKLESGRLELREEEFDWMGLIKDLALSVSPAAVEKGLELRVHASAEKIRVRGDRTRLKQVMDILLSNALKFTQKGSIEIHSSLLNGELCVEVRDTGVGIEVADQPKLFKKFSQVGWAPGGGEKGMGIGLAIAHGLVGLHGGALEVRSTPGAGSVFTIHIPARRMAAATT